MSIRLLTVKQVADAMGVCQKTVRRWVHDGDFPPPRAIGGKTIRWRESDVSDWLDSTTPTAEDAIDQQLAAGDVLAGAIHDRRSAAQSADSPSLEEIEKHNRRQHPERNELLA